MNMNQELAETIKRVCLTPAHVFRFPEGGPIVGLNPSVLFQPTWSSAHTASTNFLTRSDIPSFPIQAAMMGYTAFLHADPEPLFDDAFFNELKAIAMGFDIKILSPCEVGINMMRGSDVEGRWSKSIREHADTIVVWNKESSDEETVRELNVHQLKPRKPKGPEGG